MRTNWFAAITFVTLTLTTFAFGAPSTSKEVVTEATEVEAVTTTTETVVTEAAADEGAKPIGSIELRPTYYPVTKTSR